MLRLSDTEFLACIDCGGRLTFRGWTRGESQQLHRGTLVCGACGVTFEVDQGLARLYHEREVRGTDRLLRLVYDGMPSVHDPLVRYSFPFAVGESETQSRARYIKRLDLEELQPRLPGAPVRILEIGVGTGSNIPALRQRVPGDCPLELWGVDLSLGMLRLCQRRMRFLGDRDTRLLAADAHALPFPNHFFDRVFHVGAINGYRDPRRALSEMARVAVPGTPIVVVDERLDATRKHSLAHRLFFRIMTIYDRNPHAPVEALPEGVTDVRDEQIGRFFYCLTFRTR